MVRKSLALSVVLLAGSIVVPAHKAVNPSQNDSSGFAAQWADGSPMPVPKPPGALDLLADGSPMPVPKPPGESMLIADGSPMPVPKPPGELVLIADGSPMPVPRPPGAMTA